MRNLFYCCYSLKSLPDISKWNTNNVTKMTNMLDSYKSFLSFPDISNWNTNSVNI